MTNHNVHPTCRSCNYLPLERGLLHAATAHFKRQIIKRVSLHLLPRLFCIAACLYAATGLCEPAPLLTLCLAVFALLSQASAGPAADAERRQLAAALEREKALTLREEAVKTAELQSKAASQVCAVHCVMGKEAIQS